MGGLATSSAPFLYAFCFIIVLFCFHILSHCIYPSLLSFQSVLHIFLHLYLSSYLAPQASFSSRPHFFKFPPLDCDCCLCLCLSINPIPSLSTDTTLSALLCFSTFPPLQASVGRMLAAISISLFRACVNVCAVCVSTFGRQDSALVLPKWEIHFCFCSFTTCPGAILKNVFTRDTVRVNINKPEHRGKTHTHTNTVQTNTQSR